MIKDYYKILGLERTASTAEIHKRYKDLVKIYHPDLNKNPQALERFLQITEAFRVLGDLENRLDYSLILFEQDMIKEEARRIYRMRKKKNKK